MHRSLMSGQRAHNEAESGDPQLRYKKDCAIENLSSRQGNPLPMQRRKEEYKQREIMHSIVAIPGVSSLRVESFVRSCTLPRAAALCLDARYDRCSAHILPMCTPQIARTGEENTCARTNWNIESVYDVQRKVVTVCSIFIGHGVIQKNSRHRHHCLPSDHCTMGRLRRSRTHRAQRDVHRASRTRVSTPFSLTQC
jgi:hypothetical protein